MPIKIFGMKIPNNIKDCMDTLSEITDYGEFYYGGSISDYFNLGGIGFNYVIHDIDINIMDISTLRKIESYFNVESYLFHSSYYGHHQMILDGGLILDVFETDTSYDYYEGNYNNNKILYASPIGRHKMLVDVVTKFEKQNIYDGAHHQRIFKHLKKLMIYKRILNL